MSIYFKVLGTQLEFHDDLKKYYELSCEFQAVHDKVYKAVKSSFSIKKEPTEIFQSIETAAKQFIGDLINRLSNYGVFDRAASDYLNTNNKLKDYINFYSGGTVRYFNQHDEKKETEVVSYDEVKGILDRVIEKNY